MGWILNSDRFGAEPFPLRVWDEPGNKNFIDVSRDWLGDSFIPRLKFWNFVQLTLGAVDSGPDFDLMERGNACVGDGEALVFGLGDVHIYRVGSFFNSFGLQLLSRKPNSDWGEPQARAANYKIPIHA